jgi:hypothetical protein
MQALEPIFRSYEEGRAALLLTGRSLHDLSMDHEGRLRPLMEGLRRECRRRYGMATVVYSKAGGLDWDASRIEDGRDRHTIESALTAHGLRGIQQDGNEVARIIRGVQSLSCAPTDGLRWVSGESMRFSVLFEFTEHLAPGCLTNGTQTDPQLVSIELTHRLAQSLALRNTGNLVIFHGREGLIDELVSGTLHRIRLPQPEMEEKRRFLDSALGLYAQARLEDGLDADSVARLTRNTPNRGLEALLRASHRSGHALTAKELVAQKIRDVEELSEHTLSVLDTTRVQDLELCGRNIATPARILARLADALLHSDASMPANVLLVGPPGTGKTDLAILTAQQAKAPAYQVLNPKDPYVGGTERKARLQQMVLREWTPNIAFADEITEMLPMERSQFDGDSGASRAVLAAMLTALSDETRRGKSLLIGTTNCPWRMAEAMRSRFVLIPCLHPVREDFPAIVTATARRVQAGLEVNPQDAHIREAADIFYDKAANPRHVRAALSNTRLLHGDLNADLILEAARDFCPSADQLAVIYADLWAVKACFSRSYLPWGDKSAEYPFPSHLQGLVDVASGHVKLDELNKRLEELRPHVNL